MIGEWVYQLKYRNQTQNVSLLVDYILQKFSGFRKSYKFNCSRPFYNRAY
ncbi:hypothetical protein NEIPOLOT_00184 [Neisseria polysaccharea ATCC 43768]|nr:hypothetical protein NEIPOLOT_00184 [Neisseria polysaccharea ATCC 43768]